MGNRSMQTLVEALSQKIAPERAEGCSPFSAASSALDSLFHHSGGEELVRGVTGLTKLVQGLTADTRDAQRVAIDRPVFTKGCTIDSFSYETFQLFFVDPAPFRGPDQTGYAVLVDTLSYE